VSSSALVVHVYPKHLIFYKNITILLKIFYLVYLIMENTREEVNPFADLYEFLSRSLYEQPKKFLQHSLDDLTEDLVKSGVTCGVYYVTGSYGLALPYKIGSVAVGYYTGNAVGDLAGEYVESAIKYYVGVEEKHTPKTQEAILESFIDDVAEDLTKAVGLVDLLKWEIAVYAAFSSVGAQNSHFIAKALPAFTASIKFIESYNDWNEYSNKAGNFVSREVTEYCDDMSHYIYDFFVPDYHSDDLPGNVTYSEL
jgi:hypothetical protein